VTAPPWMPLQNAIVPLSQAPGPLQLAERLAAQRRRLDDALLEYGLRHLGAVEAIPVGHHSDSDRATRESDQLLLASARVLEGRLRWRMKQPTAGHLAGYIAPEQSREERDAYDEALQLFNRHEKNIPRQPGAARLYTDYGIALHRIGQHADALSQLDKAVASGAAPAEAFGYAGMARVALGRPKEAIVSLEKGLEIAPTDTALLTTYAITLERAGAEYRSTMPKRFRCIARRRSTPAARTIRTPRVTCSRPRSPSVPTIHGR
jgi:tetratricopeptide (TPR) repeat protein